ncbi:glucan-binding repeat-containing protein [Clostridium saccharoperbutylacetonicum]|uniref:Glucan-binding domain-containing protein n=2 Tax=Clostridium TaxID=1485 RepID=M1MKY3_9CLOT|nr:colicin E5-related ribonuclease [Clostridium saccharoperbutylacetonicum]AGF55466.1 glucan-binding domain-containing protein [Clostridium saccharoperbutylacetonicum N1-4(HMT)]NRT63819.1 glucan-binding repeat-containing protein [Clostridium saccharoperbutylacetonicum]NSB27182.1 glucan-binding repeat-containing protein [Clostridium saccharoperbutylacetonicum]NSB40669.1 glucan-binding repeat-containing protein [Clostridium saccharoperbutylacetonicum]
MKRGNALFKKIYLVTILTMLFTILLTGIQVMASTNGQQGKVNWKSTTKDEEIDLPDGVTVDGGVWKSPTYSSAEEDTSSSKLIGTLMNSGEETGAIIAALMGVLAISASKSGANETNIETVASGNGIWVPETDREAVTKMINDAASKKYYIDENGFVKAVEGAAEDASKSSTYSSVIDRLINGSSKVVIGVDDGWVSSGENGLEANAFGSDGGITVGDNHTPQVVIVNGKDTAGSKADITLAHELTHALRGELGLKSINTEGGVNKDEEAHTIELENKIRAELGYAIRTDGDNTDGGDGSYGKFNDAASEKDWYSIIDKLQGTTTLSGNAYSNYSEGSIVGIVIKSIFSSLSDVLLKKKKKSKKSRSSSSSYSVPEYGAGFDCNSDWDCDCSWAWDCHGDCEWVSDCHRDWTAFWDTAWNSAKKGANEETNKVLTGIESIMKNFIPIILNVLGLDKSNNLDDLFNIGGKTDGWAQGKSGAWYYLKNGEKQTGWIHDTDNKWYYLDKDTGKMQTGLIYDSNFKNYYYLDEHGVMQTGWIQDEGSKDWSYFDESGARKTGWFKDGDIWYYVDKNTGKMKTGWINDDGKTYYLYSSGEMATGWVKQSDGNWYYFDGTSGEMAKNKWAQYADNSWYYLDEKGLIVKDKWEQDSNGSWFYVGSDGEMVKNTWKQQSDGTWYYLGSDGQMSTGWQQINNKWYYLGDDGKMNQYWQKINGKDYYFYSNGQMVTKWMQVDDKTYYFNADGELQPTGWINDDGKYYFLDSNNHLEKGWFKYGNSWYYLDSDGKMQTGWKQDGDKWYHLDEDGQMQVGWQEVDNNWYYFDSDGKMVVNDWGEDYKGDWFYLGLNGKMVTNQWIKYNNNWYFLRQDDGRVQKGWFSDDETKLYYLDESTGKMQTGDREINGKMCHFDEDGRFLSFDGQEKGDAELDYFAAALLGVGAYILLRNGKKIFSSNVGSEAEEAGSNIKFGSDTKSTQKLSNQMTQRGWTESTVRDIVSKPYTTRASINKATGNSATVYYNKAGGYVIIDDITKSVVQVSDNINPSTWIPDPSIIDPFKP